MTRTLLCRSGLNSIWSGHDITIGIAARDLDGFSDDEFGPGVGGKRL